MRQLAAIVLVICGACSGSLDGPEPGTDGGNEPRTVEVEGPAILAHVQAFANAACTDVDACTISTYNGHHPVAARALDILVSDVYGKLPTDANALGDALAAYVLANQAEHGIWYVIWRQRYNDGGGWDPMEDRGSITQNHYDHVHVSFNETAP